MSAVSQDAIAVTQGDRLVSRDRSARGRRAVGAVGSCAGCCSPPTSSGSLAAYRDRVRARAARIAVDRVAPIWEVALFVATLPLWVLLARIYGLYDRDEERTDHSTVDDVVGVFQVVTLGTWSFLVLTHVVGLPYPNLGRLVVFWLLAVVLVPLLRAASRAIGRRQAAYVQNVIIVGSGYVARMLADKIEKHPEYGLRVVGFVDDDDRRRRRQRQDAR